MVFGGVSGGATGSARAIKDLVVTGYVSHVGALTCAIQPPDTPSRLDSLIHNQLGLSLQFDNLAFFVYDSSLIIHSHLF